MKRFAAVFLGALAFSAPVHAQITLGQAYKTLRPVLCAAMNQPVNCPLPEDLVVPADPGTVRRAVDASSSVYLAGSSSDLKDVRAVLEVRARNRPGAAYWFASRAEAGSLEAWAARAGTQQYPIHVLPVEESEPLGVVSRIPFVLTDSTVFFPLAGAWFEPTGRVTATVLSVLRNIASYTAQQALARKTMKEAEAR